MFHAIFFLLILVGNVQIFQNAFQNFLKNQKPAGSKLPTTKQIH